MTKQIKERIESIEGCSVSEAIATMYIDRQFSLNDLSKRWNINFRTIDRIFNNLGIERRSKSESVKLQWIDASERKEKASKFLSDYRQNNPHPLLGVTRIDASERMKQFNPMFDNKIKDIATYNRNQTYNKNPERRNMYHKALTECEQIVFDLFQNNGITAIGNELINGRFIDVYLPQFNIGIECICNRFPLSFDRHQKITANGMHVIYAKNNFIRSNRVTALYDYIINPNIFGCNPSFKSEESMIFSSKKGMIFDCSLNNFTINHIFVNGIDFTKITTTS